MATFDLTKKASDVEEGVKVPEDWYEMEILEEPTKEPNKKKLTGKSEEEGGGDNILIVLRLNHEDPRYDGAQFRIWLPYPNEADKKIFFRGQSKEDSKLSLIIDVYAAFKGIEAKDVEGDEVEFNLGDRAEFYVTQGLDQQGTNVVNQVSVFTHLPRPVGGLVGSEQKDDDIPF